MGMTIWILAEGEQEDDRDHSIMLMKDKSLDKLAKSIGVTKLSEFYDYSTLEGEFGGEASPKYSSADEIEKSISALIKAIKEGRSEKLEKVEGLMEELEDCVKKALNAKNNNKNVRLAILP